MTDWPKISIVIPNYNGGETLGETLQSIVSQNYPCLEIIVVDGGSSDNSVDVIKQYGKDVTWWVSEKDNGMYDAVNKGFTKATGDIFAWIGSGDLYFPNAFRTVGDVMRSLPQVRWLTTLTPILLDFFGNSIAVCRPSGYSKLSFLDGRHLPGERGYTNVIMQESTFWRHDLWEQAGGSISTEYSLCGDFDLWTIFFDIADLHVIESPLAGFRCRSGQLSTDIAEYVEQGRRILASMRTRNRWTRSWIRDAFSSYGLRLSDVFGFRKFMRLMLSYQSKQVIRENPGTEHGSWRIVTSGYL